MSVSDSMLNISRSQLDEERFDMRVAKSQLFELEHVAEAEKYCLDNQIVLSIARCTAERLDLAQALEEQGYRLMDSLIYYQLLLRDAHPPADQPGVNVRSLQPEDVEKVIQVAQAAFHHYLGHYHADPNLAPEKCDEVYVSWAQRSCELPNVVDQVLVAEKGEAITGFATLKRQDAETGDGVLFAVHPAFQRQGIYQALLAAAIQWCQNTGCKRMLYSTQITNYAAQRALVRLGFTPMSVYYTFHKWFPSA